VYDLPAEVLNTLSLKPVTDGQEIEALEEPTETLDDDSRSSAGTESAVGAPGCSLCAMTFATVLDQRGHLKSDLHQYNLKQKLRGLNPVSEADFENLIGNLDESLSGSDSSDSEDDDEGSSRKETILSTLLKKQASLVDKSDNPDGDDDEPNRKMKAKRGGGAANPLLWFTSPVLPKDNYFGAYRSIFQPSELENEDKIMAAIKKRQLPPISMPKPNKDGSLPPAAYKGPHIFLCMIGGGHFAAMVVSLAPRQSKHASSSGPLNREATVLAHKTFHRYTTRRKQGGSQSANDNAKGAAHSAGASIRRYNEQALVEDVRALLQEWKALLDTSDLLFIRATGSTNRRTLFGPYDGQVLRANDERIRGFPFSTRRATQNELMRAYIELTRLKVREIGEVKAEEVVKTGSKTEAVKPEKPKLTEEEEKAIQHTTQIQGFIRRSKLPALLSYLTSNKLEPSFRFYPPGANHHAPTPLHLAAAQNAAPIVTGLLVRAGADPTVRSEEDKTAFEIAGDRTTRDAFRLARGTLGEGKWDWDKAGVPAALTKEEVDRQKEIERKEKERQEKAERERKRVEEERLKAQRVPLQGTSRRGGVLGGPKSAQEKREEEGRGLTPEQRMRLERERRARAAEERIKRMQGGV
jgi:hypothetical protein